MDTIRDIDLLRREMATLWERDAYGRLSPRPMGSLAVAADGEWAVRFEPGVRDELRRKIEEDGLPVPEKIRERLGPSRVSSGPSYVFPDDLLPVESPLIEPFTSDVDVPAKLRAARPEAWWEPGEWEDLLAGRLGPWAIGMIEGRVAALCHTPVGSAVAAEAGVWTHPDERGRGYAGAVTAAWAQVARRRFGTLFYSTGAENVASQAVARKLGLRAIGEIWQFWSEG